MKRFTIIVCLFLSLVSLSAKEKKNKNIDYLGVTAVLIRDGNYSRAEETLNELDPGDEKLDKVRYYTLMGLIQLRKSEFREALESFRTAMESGDAEAVIWAYIVQAHFALGEYKETIESIDQLPNINQFPDLYGMKSQAYWYLGDTAEAFNVLETGIGRYPDKTSFLRQKVIYFLELELNRAAVDTSLEFLEKEGGDSEDFLTIAAALRSGKQYQEAVRIMEQSLLIYPDNPRLLLMLAQCYVDLNRPLTAAKLVERVSIQDPAFTKDAALLYSQAGNLHRARYLNTIITDPADKARLRFNILLADEDYEAALALIPRLERTGILQDESTLYAAAYVLFQVQRYEESIQYLSRIKGSRYFRQASKLRQAIEIIKRESLRLF